MAAQVPTLAGITREAVPCHLCSNTHSSPYLEGRGFTVVRCDVCGLFYVNPQPSAQELTQLYARFDSGDQWRQGEEDRWKNVAKIVMRALSEILYRATLGRTVFGYSTLVTAQKE